MTVNEALAQDDGEGALMTLTEHLTELRSRLIKCLVAVGGMTVVCLFFAGPLIDWLKATAPPELTFHTRHPTEVFVVYVKVAGISGMFFSMPLIFYQIWAFIQPGLRKIERRYAQAFVPSFAIFFFGGALFARYVAIPLGVSFLLAFAGGLAEPVYMIGDYVSFVLVLMLVFGLLFEFPILLYLAGSVGLVRSEQLRKKRGIVLLGIFIAAAALTPTPDAGTQVALGLPLYVLFEITLRVMSWRGF